MFRKENDETSIWISTTDLMSGMLVLFLFISVLLTQQENETKGKLKSINENAIIAQRELQSSLNEEFGEKGLSKYNLDTGKDLSKVGHASFLDGESRFKQGSAVPTSDFENELRVFLPKYLKAIKKCDDKDKNLIKEIRIEGHTSSEWHANVSPDQAYINNMELSQARTRAILEFALAEPSLQEYRPLIKEKLTANGLSSSKLKYKPGTSIEDKEASRRIEFRVVVNDDRTIKAIREAIGLDENRK